MGESLAFVIEANGLRIYIDSGGAPNALPAKNIAPVDLAILGVALPDSRARFAEIVQQLRPRYILPSHQDDFFAPLNRGFTFVKLTNFPQIIRHHRNSFRSRLRAFDWPLCRGTSRQLRAAAQSVTEGRLDVQVPLHRADEFGALSANSIAW